MKKILILILTAILLLPLFSCEKNLINNADTGEIILAENKYDYIDGTYYSGYDYFDAYGYSAVMKMTIKDGIIKSVRFDYFTADNTPFSEKTDEELSEEITNFRSARKSLYNQTLASQSISGIQYSQSDKYCVDYFSLASDILYSAKNSGDSIIIRESVNTYDSSVQLTEEVFAQLSATYVSDDISQIDFDITDQSGSSLSLDGATCMEVFGIGSEEMTEVISVLESTGETASIIKENTEESLNTIFDVYNSLAEIIESSRQKTAFSYSKLF